MDRKEEIIRLQTEIIRGLARQGLNRVGLDLWAPPPLPPAKPRVAASGTASTSTPNASAAAAASPCRFLPLFILRTSLRILD